VRRIALAGLLFALTAQNAAATDPGRWVDTGMTTLPSEYWQGVAFDPAGSAWFAGPQQGLYRTGPELTEQARVAAGIAPGEPFNHIGDVEWDAGEGGRLLLPLECYDPFASPQNTCGIGAVGVADPATLAWRYAVRLNGVPKAMWLALGEDGTLWTQAGPDLVGFDADAVRPGAGAIDPVRVLPGAHPEQASGGAVLGGRLYTAVQPSPDRMQLHSADLATGARVLEAEREIVGESEGLAAYPGLGGTLHWLVAPGLVTAGTQPTFGRTNSVLMHLAPTGVTPPGARQRLSEIRLRVTPRRPRAGRPVRLRLRATARVVGRTVPADGAVVRSRGKSVFLNEDGRGSLRVRAPRRGRLVVRATRPAMSADRVVLRVRRKR
jgi:hypothetical protein